MNEPRRPAPVEKASESDRKWDYNELVRDDCGARADAEMWRRQEGG